MRLNYLVQGDKYDKSRRKFAVYSWASHILDAHSTSNPTSAVYLWICFLVFAFPLLFSHIGTGLPYMLMLHQSFFLYESKYCNKLWTSVVCTFLCLVHLSFRYLASFVDMRQEDLLQVNVSCIAGKSLQHPTLTTQTVFIFQAKLKLLHIVKAKMTCLSKLPA